MEEYISKAAVKYCDKIYTGYDHGKAFAELDRDNHIIIMNKIEEGFITSLDRFVSRKEAMEIAKKADQLQYITEKQTLISEDIYLDWLKRKDEKIKELEEKNKTYYNKLVRDRIPEIIKASGKKPKYRVLNDEEYKQALKDKLLEEVNEFCAARTKAEMNEEIADIKEVLSAILITFKLGKGRHNMRHIKAVEKGCFAQRFFLESVEEIANEN